MKKKETLQAWRELPAGLDPLAVMEPIGYKARGSRYGACGVRVDGCPEFIDAVLSNLKSLLAGENHITRLELARSVVDGRGLGKEFPNAAHNERAAEVCYIRLHRRGHEGATASAIFDRELDGNQLTFEETRRAR